MIIWVVTTKIASQMAVADDDDRPKRCTRPDRGPSVGTGAPRRMTARVAIVTAVHIDRERTCKSRKALP